MEETKQPVVDANERLIAKQDGKKLFLVDSSIIILFREVAKALGIHPFDVIEEVDGLHFFVTNDVVLEVQRDEDIRNFARHMLNGGFPNDGNKFNLYPYMDEKGEYRAVQLNALSPVDFGQIVMCQKYPQLTLVTNDKKQLKSGKAVLGQRVVGLPAFLDAVTGLADNNPRWKKITQFIEANGERRPLESRWIVPGLTDDQDSRTS